MKHKEDLFHLIKSMSKSEKRYFTIEASKWGNSETKYLELYQFINGMKSYDEEVLKKKFPKNLSADKNYLYESLLKNLRDFKRNSSFYSRIRELIMDAKNLYKRGLYSQVENRLVEAKSLAMEIGDQLALLEINKLEPFISWHTNKDFIQHINTLFDERKQIQSSLNAEFKFTELSYLLSMVFKKGVSLEEWLESHPDLQKMMEIISKPDQSVKVDYHAKRRLHQCNAIHAQMSGEHERASASFAEVVDWWKDYKKYKSEEFSRYVVDVSNLINAYYKIEAFDKVWEQIERLEEEATDDIEVKGLIFLKTSIFKILFFLNTGKAEDLNQLGEKINHGLSKYQLNEGSRISLISNMAVYGFCCENFDKCIEWCEKVTKQRNKSETRIRDQVGLQLLWLMSKIELDNIDEIENAFRSVRRFLKQKEVFEEGRFEYTFFHLLKNLAPLFGRERTAHWGKIKEELSNTILQAETAVPLDLNELGVYWAESRSNGKSILEIIRHQRKD